MIIINVFDFTFGFFVGFIISDLIDYIIERFYYKHKKRR